MAGLKDAFYGEHSASLLIVEYEILAQAPHKVRPQVRLEPRNTILPPDLFKQYVGLPFWKEKRANSNNLITFKDPPSSPHKLKPLNWRDRMTRKTNPLGIKDTAINGNTLG